MRLFALLLAAAAQTATAAAATPPFVEPVLDPYALIDKADPQVARNERLVLDYARLILEAGHFELIGEFVAPDYVQHSAGMPPGRDGLVSFFGDAFPRREIQAKLRAPIFTMLGQGELVLVGQPIWPVLVAGKTSYRGSHFDLFRVHAGRIVEHWDSVDAAPSPVK